MSEYPPLTKKATCPKCGATEMISHEEQLLRAIFDETDECQKCQEARDAD